jgi:hypothetical protein
MKYKVLIQQCSDPKCAGSVAFAIARRAGVTPEKAFGVISEKTVCIRKKAEYREALLLKNEFEALGAAVQLVALDEYLNGGRTSAAASGNVRSDDDDDDTPGRIVSENEYAARMRERGDIFYIENNRSLKRIQTACLGLAIITGMFMSTRKIALIPPDFIEANAPTRQVVLTDKVIARPVPERPVPKQVEQPTTRTVLKPKPSTGSGGRTGGGGSPYERVTKTGVLGLLSGQIKGKSVVNADIFSKGGYADGIDAILVGLGGLKPGGSGGTGRKGETGMGFGTGYKNGFGGEPGIGGIGTMIDNLFGADFANALSLKQPAGSLRMSPPTFAHGGALTNGRSRQSISRVVQQNLAALRHAYNQRLREKPGLKGRITVKFAIDEFGKVLLCSIEETTIDDQELEKVVINKISRWKFEKIDKVGDVTEVIYPFVFSQ